VYLLLNEEESTMNAGALVPVIVAGMQEKYIRAFRQAGAIRPASATTLERVGCRESSVVGSLIRQGVLVAMDGGRYYLDTDAVESLAAHRRIGVMVAVGALAIGLVLLMLLR
jgi:hypothetical protein